MDSSTPEEVDSDYKDGVYFLKDSDAVGPLSPGMVHFNRDLTEVFSFS